MPSYLTLLLLLIPFTLGAAPECSKPSACYGMPVNCQPDTDCHFVLNFDAQGNLDLYINDVIDPMGYVAVAVDSTKDGDTEYVFCIPHQEQRLRGIATANEPVRITEQPMAKYVRSLARPNSFVCSFLATELPEGFQNRDVFSTVEGVYEENLMIPQGAQLSEPLYLHPVAFRSSVLDSDDGVLSPDERKSASDLLGTLRRINDGEDTDLESLLLEEKNKDSASDDDDLEDMLDSDKKYSTRRRQKDSEDRKSKSRPSRYQEEDEEAEDEVEEIPKRKSNNKKSNRRAKSEDEEELEEEEEEEAEEEEDEMEERPKKKNKKDLGKKGGRRGGRKEQNDEDEEDDDEDEYMDEKGSNTDEDYDNAVLTITPFLATAISMLVVVLMI